MGSDNYVSLPQFYAHKTVFITGATGFVGKCIVEKLLRSCPDIERIYVLVRYKKNQSAEERLQVILEEMLFDRIRQSPNREALFQKVIAINGDITLTGLGISLEAASILKSSVSVVFHAAANVKFNSRFEALLKSNTEGTKNVLDWSKELEKLKAFVYISTAFSNCDKTEIGEEVYPIDVDPHLAIKLYSGLRADLVDSIAMKEKSSSASLSFGSILTGEKKIHYAFTKHLAEVLVQEAGNNHIPVCIVRPSIVTGAEREPFPGWIDNFNGPGGLFVGMAKGIVRCCYKNERGTLDVVPIDHVVNLSLAAAYHLGSGFGDKNDLKVYNCSSCEHPLVVTDLYQTLLESFGETPFNELIWYPSWVFVRSWFAFTVINFFLHYLPAWILDFSYKLMRKKPKVSLMQIYKKTRNIMGPIEFVSRTYFSFETSNTVDLFKQLSPADRKDFNFDIQGVDMRTYVKDCVYGYRHYAFKEKDEDLPNAKKNFTRYRRMYYISLFFLVMGGVSVIFGLLTWLLIMRREE